MLTVISGNNRNGYPCALNKVGDIFQHSTLPFETEGLTYFKSGNSQDASQKGAFPLAGPLSKIFFRVKVTTLGSAEVTVSMTSKASRTSGKYDSGSHLSSPKSGRTKYRQHRSHMQGVTMTSRNTINGLASAHMVGVCPDNLLNIKADSTFVQSLGKEKGPEVNPTLLSTLIISSPRNSQRLKHNSPLRATSFTEWHRASQALGSMPRDCNSFLSIRLIQVAKDESPSFFISASSCSRSSSVKRIGNCGERFWGIDMAYTIGNIDRVYTSVYVIQYQKQRPVVLNTHTGRLTTNDNAIIEVAMRNYTALIGRDKPSFTQTRPKFTDTYWVIPEYSTVPYGKVSFTRQDRRTFITLFKDSRLIWAGRQPVQGIVEITTHQGRVNITPPSTIEEISMVPATITNIVTVQAVTHG